MRSEQRTEIVGSDSSGSQDGSQGALKDVSTCVDRHGDGRPVGMLHDVVAARDPCNLVSGTLQRLDYLCSRYGRDGTRHNAESYQKSGDVECQSQLVRRPDFLDQTFKRGTQVRDRVCLRFPLAECRSVGAQVGRGSPETSLVVLLKGVGHVNDTSHAYEYGTDVDDGTGRLGMAVNAVLDDNVSYHDTGRQCMAVNLIGTSGDVLTYD